MQKHLRPTSAILAHIFTGTSGSFFCVCVCVLFTTQSSAVHLLKKNKKKTHNTRTPNLKTFAFIHSWEEGERRSLPLVRNRGARSALTRCTYSNRKSVGVWEQLHGEASAPASSLSPLICYHPSLHQLIPFKTQTTVIPSWTFSSRKSPHGNGLGFVPLPGKYGASVSDCANRGCTYKFGVTPARGEAALSHGAHGRGSITTELCGAPHLKASCSVFHSSANILVAA